MSFSIEIIESKNQIISGIPESFEIIDQDSVIFYYTLDGTDPDQNSIPANGKIELPTIGGLVELKVVGVKIDDESGEFVEYSDIFYKKYYSSPYDDSRTRHSSGPSGVIIIPYNSEIVDNLSELQSGDNAQETSIEFEELELKASYVSRSGYNIPSGSSISFIKRSIDNSNNAMVRSISSVNSIDFNPKANVIEVFGETREDRRSQTVSLVNRTYNSIGTVSKFYDENWKQDEQVITGNLVRTMHDPVTGIIVFYYWDSKESRWLISRQNVGPQASVLNIGAMPGGRGSSSRMVYRWIQDRSATRIF